MSSFREIFLIFLKLGCLSFGGPTAHLGYFHAECVERRKWLSEQSFADLIALCQFMPGPASSQVGLSIGLLRGGRRGALAAWLGFTLPTALILTVLALGLTQFGGNLPNGLLLGLAIAAASVVAKALWMMWKKLCPDVLRSALAVLSMALVLGFSSVVPLLGLQLGIIILGALAGILLLDKAPRPANLAAAQVRAAPLALPLFFTLLVALPILAIVFPNIWLGLIDTFYRTGAMVFGGGHVVLPLLDAQTVEQGLISEQSFMAGYGAAQAMPGPLFGFSAYLGGIIAGPWGALAALLAIYVPSFLLVFGLIPIWQRISSLPYMRAALTGINAVVVGLLAAAFVTPVLSLAIWRSGHVDWLAAALVLFGFAILQWAKCPPWLWVILSAIFGTVFL